MAETIKCMHCLRRVRVIDRGGVARIEEHALYSGQLCKGAGTIKGKWRDDPTYRRTTERGNF